MIYKSNQNFKKESLELLKNNWGIAIVACFIVWFLGSSADTLTTTSIEEIYKDGQVIRKTVENKSGVLGIVNFLFGGPILFGAAAFFLKLKRNKLAQVKDVFSGFDNFFKYFFTELIKTIFIVLWTLLLVVPGIIAYYKYSMTWYILNDNPELTFMEAISRSKDLMLGNKMTLFSLQLSFLGWFLLASAFSLVTFGLAYLPMQAYYKGAEVSFYEELIATREISVDY